MGGLKQAVRGVIIVTSTMAAIAATAHPALAQSHDAAATDVHAPFTDAMLKSFDDAAAHRERPAPRSPWMMAPGAHSITPWSWAFDDTQVSIDRSTLANLPGLFGNHQDGQAWTYRSLLTGAHDPPRDETRSYWFGSGFAYSVAVIPLPTGLTLGVAGLIGVIAHHAWRKRRS